MVGTNSSRLDLNQYIRDVPDFPKPGILFKDITPLLSDRDALRESVVRMADLVRDQQIDLVGAAEARGFIFGAPLALELGVGFVPIRKPGKLPYNRVTEVYQLEYGTDTLEMHSDAVQPGTRILLVDDVLATGGTMKACCDLVRKMGADVVACLFLIELGFLDGRARLNPNPVQSVLNY